MARRFKPNLRREGRRIYRNQDALSEELSHGIFESIERAVLSVIADLRFSLDHPRIFSTSQFRPAWDRPPSALPAETTSCAISVTEHQQFALAKQNFLEENDDKTHVLVEGETPGRYEHRDRAMRWEYVHCVPLKIIRANHGQGKLNKDSAVLGAVKRYSKRYGLGNPVAERKEWERRLKANEDNERSEFELT